MNSHAFWNHVWHRERVRLDDVANRRLSTPPPTGIRRTFPPLGHFAVEYLLALPAGAAIALAWANTFAESYFRFVHALAFWVNDVLMVLFFAWMAKEVAEAAAPGGILHSPHRLVLPAIAAVGIVGVPLSFYLAFIAAIDAPLFEHGWPTIAAVDLALGYFIMRAIFGRHPAVPFFLVLGIAANGLGFIAIALTVRAPDTRVLLASGLMAAALMVASALRTARITAVWPYLFGAGGVAWSALYWGGFHPALALVPIVPFLPHAARDPGFFVDAPANALDTLSRLERWCRHPAQIALFFFGLVNAGVQLRGLEQSALALPLATLAGRPIGLAAAVAFGLGLRLHLPPRIGYRELVVIGLAAGAGFTMALFFAASAIPPGQVLTETKMGAMLSVAGVIAAYGTARILRVGRFSR